MSSSHMLGRTAIVTALALTVMLSACSKSETTAKPAAAAANVTLTAAQRQNVRLYTVAQSKFRKSIETSGAVDFDNDQATAVLAPFSGPVAKVLVDVGARVKQGDALAIVESPDFAAAI